MAKVTLIVAIYNTGKYLKPCLDSLVNQTFKEIEIILIDDESSDGSEKICDSYAEMDTRVKVVHKKNEGLSMARNTGVEHATTDYIIFIDGDDYIENDMVEKLFNAIKEYNADIAECGVRWVYDDKNVDNVVDELVVCDNIKGLEYLLNDEKFVVMAWNKIYKKELFKDIEYPRGCIHEDVGTTYKLIRASKKIVSIPYIGYNYIQRASSISHLKFDKRHLVVIKFLEDIYVSMKEINPKLSSKAYEKLMMSLIYWYTKAVQDNVTEKEIFCELENAFRKNLKYLPDENIEKKIKMKIKAFAINPSLYIKIKFLVRK
ncbi:MAG: glycosyltransferase family 2 protein [Sarcina sp.]